MLQLFEVLDHTMLPELLESKLAYILLTMKLYFV